MVKKHSKRKGGAAQSSEGGYGSSVLNSQGHTVYSGVSSGSGGEGSL